MGQTFTLVPHGNYKGTNSSLREFNTNPQRIATPERSLGFVVINKMRIQNLLYLRS
jgi:hypothetical protein